MHPLAERTVIIGLRVDQLVKLIHNLAITHKHDAHAADALRMLVGRLKIDRIEVAKL